MGRLRTLAAILSAIAASIAYASDWQYAGYAKSGNVESHQFFDADGVSHPTKDTTRVWVKAIRVRDFDRYRKAHKKLVVEKTARKIVTGYSPSFLELPAIKASFTDAKAVVLKNSTASTGALV